MDRKTLLICLCVAGLNLSSMANGFRIASHDAHATARGEAFAATADNASAVYYNPAGIAQQPGHNAQLGVYGIALGLEYEPESGPASESDNDLAAVPHLFYSYGVKNLPIALGFGLYAPFGLANKWPEETGFRSVALESELSYITLNPVAAWRVLTNLSIAVGPTFSYSKIELKRGVTPFPENDFSKLEGDGTAVGFNAGLLWQPHKKISLGLAYRSRTEVDYDGHTELSFVVPPPGYPPYMKMSAKAELPFPQSVVAGISFRPTPRWNIEFDVDWTDWNALNTVDIQQSIPASIEMNWESSFYYELGLTRYFGEKWQVSAGYIYNQNSVPDKTFNPWVPDQDRHFICVGFGYRGEYFSLDVAYQFGYGPTRSVTGSARSAVGQTADGDYEYMSQGFAITAGFRF